MSDKSPLPSGTTASPPPRRPVQPRVVDREAIAPTTQPGEFPALRPYQPGPRPKDADIVDVREARPGPVFALGVSMVDHRLWPQAEWFSNPILALMRRRARGVRVWRLVLATMPFVALLVIDLGVAWTLFKWPGAAIVLMPWYILAGALLGFAATVAMVAATVRWNLGTLPLDELRVTALRTEHIVQAMLLPPLATANAVVFVFVVLHTLGLAVIHYYWNESLGYATLMALRLVAMVWAMPLVLAHTAAVTLRAHLFLRRGVLASTRAVLDSVQPLVVAFGAIVGWLVLAVALYAFLGFALGRAAILATYFLLPLLLVAFFWTVGWAARFLRGETSNALEFCWNERDEWWASLGPPPDDTRLGLRAAPRRQADIGERPIHELPERGLLTPWRATTWLD